MKTAIEVFLAVAGRGGNLGIAGDRLRMLLPADWAPRSCPAMRESSSAPSTILHLTFRHGWNV